MDTGGAGEEGASGGLVLRILGTPEEVAGIESRIRDLTPWDMGDATVLEGKESRAFHEGMEMWEDGAELVLRLSLLPSELPTLLKEAIRLRESSVFGHNPTPRLSSSSHVGAGVCRVSIRDLPQDRGAMEELSRTLTDLRRRLEAQGGSLRVSHGPREILEGMGPWVAVGRVHGIMEGLKARFDPHRILAPGRLGL
jgi:hypothetical protein